MKRKHNPKPRTTQQLTGTHSKVTASLDFESLLAIEWTRRVLRSGGPQSVHISGVIRRALLVYVHHLAQADPRSEYMATARASKAREVPDEDAQLAELRLLAVPEGEPMPAFEVIRDGPQKVAERAAMHQRIEQLLETMKP